MHQRVPISLAVLIATMFVGMAVFTTSVAADQPRPEDLCVNPAPVCSNGGTPILIAQTNSVPPHCVWECQPEAPLTCKPGTVKLCPGCAVGPDGSTGNCSCKCVKFEPEPSPIIIDGGGIPPLDTKTCWHHDSSSRLWYQPVDCTDASCNYGPCVSSQLPPDVGGGSSDDGGGQGGSSDEAVSDADQRQATEKVKITSIPTVVTQLFTSVFGRDITPAESTYWKGRMRSDKPTVAALTGAMQWHKLHGSTGVPAGSVAGATSSVSPHRINALFRSVYGHNPTVSENKYWLSRLADKKTVAALLGAMEFHRIHHIGH